MKIHPSSLAYTPPRYNVVNNLETPQSGYIDSVSKHEFLETQQGSNKPQELQKIDLETVSDRLEHSNTQRPVVNINHRTAQAVDAYRQENSQISNSQYSKIVSRVDFFA